MNVATWIVTADDDSKMWNME